jgi:hypothetical protein
MSVRRMAANLRPKARTYFNKLLDIQERGDEPMADKSKKQIAAEIERLTALADRLPEGERRQKLVARIADLNVEYQAED